MDIAKRVKNNIISQLTSTEEKLAGLVREGKINPVVYHTSFSRNVIRNTVANHISDALKYGILYDQEKNHSVSSEELSKIGKFDLLKIEVEIAEYFEMIGQQRNFI